MSTKTTNTTTNTYDPTSMSTYQGMQGGLGSAIGGYMNNPFSNPFMQTQMQMGTNQANQLGGSAMSNISRNMTASGMSGSNNPAALEMMQNQSRANSGMRANLGFLAPMQNAFTAQQNAMGLASQYRPLQTGGTQTQTKSGLGTWLPQLIGGGISALTGGLMGGMAGSGGQQQSDAQMSNVWNSGAMTNMPTGGGAYNSPFTSQMPGFGMSGGSIPGGGYNMPQSNSFMQPQQPSY